MTDNSLSDIKKPYLKDGKWLIFEDSVFENLETSDCNDTMSGQCYEDKTFEQCVDMCQKNTHCNFGYYISDLKIPNICVPLHKHSIYTNPVYRLRNKDIYPELKNARIKTFIDQTKYPFPPKEGNNIFFMDNFEIQNVETGYWLNESPIKTNSKDVIFSEKKDNDISLYVQTIRIPGGLSASVQYITLKYGELIAFNIPTTSFILRQSINNPSKLEWFDRIGNIQEHSSFEIHPIMPGKKIGDNILYSDIFIIKSDVNILGLDPKSQEIKLYYETLAEAKEKSRKIIFSFIYNKIINFKVF